MSLCTARHSYDSGVVHVIKRLFLSILLLFPLVMSSSGTTRFHGLYIKFPQRIKEYRNRNSEG